MSSPDNNTEARVKGQTLVEHEMRSIMREEKMEDMRAPHR